jgi:predicted metal-dependent hydrolase
MRLIPDKRTDMRLKIAERHFEIYYPHDINLLDENVQATIRKMIEHVWNVEACEYLPSRINALAYKNGLAFKKLTIKNIRSYWGKCCGNNDIILNLHLMHLPDHLIDYIILHELCHTIHKGHHKKFWLTLDKLTNTSAKKLSKELGNYSTKNY